MYTKIKNKLISIYQIICFKKYCIKKSCNVKKILKILNPKYIYLGKNIRIKPGARLECYDFFASNILCPKLIIEDNVIIGYNFSCLVADKVIIGKDTIVASNVLITSENHGINPESNLQYHEQPLVTGKVTIGKGCWIGEKVIILPNVSIGNKSIISAGSVVTKDVPDYCIVAGVPAKIIKKYNFNKHIWEKV